MGDVGRVAADVALCHRAITVEISVSWKHVHRHSGWAIRFPWLLPRMDVVWQDNLRRYREQFNLLESRWPDLRLTISVAEQRHRSRLEAQPERLKNRNIQWATHEGFIPRPGEPAWLQILMWQESSGGVIDPSAVKQFRRLAEGAGELIPLLPDELHQLFVPSDPPHKYAGIADSLWLSHRLERVSREAQLDAARAFEKCGPTEHQRCTIEVPERDGYVWRGTPQCFESWCLLIQNIGWRLPKADAMHLPLTVRTNESAFVVNSHEEWESVLSLHRQGGGQDPFPLPLEWISCDFNWSPFLHSVWAIDHLLAAIAEPTPSADVSPRNPDTNESKQSVEAEQIDHRGYVTNLTDTSSYLPFTKIVSDHAPTADVSEYQLRRIITESPSIRKWKPSKQRLFVHLVEWIKFRDEHKFESLVNGAPAWNDDPAQQDETKSVIRTSGKKRK